MRGERWVARARRRARHVEKTCANLAEPGCLRQRRGRNLGFDAGELELLAPYEVGHPGHRLGSEREHSALLEQVSLSRATLVGTHPPGLASRPAKAPAALHRLGPSVITPQHHILETFLGRLDRRQHQTLSLECNGIGGES